ncbi:hypothetical protein EYF80_007377 [Liparis tanakae]|uniref:Uncharacterized protein n=1 Tax=Liparis tanakae TaxID=230148 RepID=A0A4Z2IWW8_9TELE|nr:hypothetical protein EYF80_007377 [Liparis tanakae]
MDQRRAASRQRGRPGVLLPDRCCTSRINSVGNRLQKFPQSSSSSEEARPALTRCLRGLQAPMAPPCGQREEGFDWSGWMLDSDLDLLTLNKVVGGHRVAHCGAEPHCSWVDLEGRASQPGAPSLGLDGRLLPASPERWTETRLSRTQQSTVDSQHHGDAGGHEDGHDPGHQPGHVHSGGVGFRRQTPVGLNSRFSCSSHSSH